MSESWREAEKARRAEEQRRWAEKRGDVLREADQAVVEYLEALIDAIRAGARLEPGQQAVYGLVRWVDQIDGRD